MDGRAALVTGAGRGCGEAVSKALASLGAKVCVSDLNPDRADRVAAEIAQTGGESFAHQADVTNRFQVGSLIENMRDRWGRLDILVNAAHITPITPLLAMDEWDWRRTLDVNLTGAFFAAQLCARVMADEGGGWIIILSNPPESPGAVGQAAWEASQAGLLPLAQSLQAETADKRVHVAAWGVKSPDDAASSVLDWLRKTP